MVVRIKGIEGISRLAEPQKAERLGFRLSLLLAATSIGCALGATPPLSKFPDPVPGDVDAALPGAKDAFAKRYPNYELLKLQSASTWQMERHPNTGLVIARYAEVDFGYREGASCHFVRHAIAQEHGPDGWAPEVILASDYKYVVDHDEFCRHARIKDEVICFPRNIDCAQLEGGSDAPASAAPTGTAGVAAASEAPPPAAAPAPAPAEPPPSAQPSP
jgi:hypothetical protein